MVSSVSRGFPGRDKNGPWRKRAGLTKPTKNADRPESVKVGSHVKKGTCLEQENPLLGKLAKAKRRTHPTPLDQDVMDTQTVNSAAVLAANTPANIQSNKSKPKTSASEASVISGRKKWAMVTVALVLFCLSLGATVAFSNKRASNGQQGQYSLNAEKTAKQKGSGGKQKVKDVAMKKKNPTQTTTTPLCDMVCNYNCNNSWNCSYPYVYQDFPEMIICDDGNCTNEKCCNLFCDTYNCDSSFLTLKDDLDSIICDVTGCDDATCCEPKTCDTYTCGHPLVDRDFPAMITCDATGCTNDKCCQRFCNTHTCATNLTLKDVASSITCSVTACDDATCCEPKTCDTYTCGHPLVDRDFPAMITCDATGCTNDKCCQRFCNTHTCATNLTLKNVASSITCNVTACDDATCCEPKTCNTYSCANTNLVLRDRAVGIMCLASGCNDDICCEPMTCQSFVDAGYCFNTTTGGRRLDFGTPVSPLETGFTRGTASSMAPDYTWTSLYGGGAQNLDSRDRSAMLSTLPNLLNDFVFCGATAGPEASVKCRYKLTLPGLTNGPLQLRIRVGDSAFGHDGTLVQVFSGSTTPQKTFADISTTDVTAVSPPAWFDSGYQEITVANNTVELTFIDQRPTNVSGTGCDGNFTEFLACGSDGSWVINAVEVAKFVTEPRTNYDMIPCDASGCNTERCCQPRTCATGCAGGSCCTAGNDLASDPESICCDLLTGCTDARCCVVSAHVTFGALCHGPPGPANVVHAA
eukprot:g31453.t1